MLINSAGFAVLDPVNSKATLAYFILPAAVQMLLPPPPPPPLASSQTALDPSHFKNCPDEGESCPIFVTLPEPSNVNAAVPPPSFKDPPSSIVISPSTTKLPSPGSVDVVPTLSASILA